MPSYAPVAEHHLLNILLSINIDKYILSMYMVYYCYFCLAMIRVQIILREWRITVTIFRSLQKLYLLCWFTKL